MPGFGTSGFGGGIYGSIHTGEKGETTQPLSNMTKEEREKEMPNDELTNERNPEANLTEDPKEREVRLSNLAFKELLGKIDIKKLLTYSQILLDITEDRAHITAYTESEEIDTVSINRGDSYSQDNSDEITYLCKIMNTIKYLTGMDLSKHREYRFICGMEPNGDDSINQLDDIIDSKSRELLYERGYDIIKRIDDY